MNHQPDNPNLPDDWTECRLGEVCAFVGGGTPSKANTNYWNGNIPWASIKDIKGDFLTQTQDCITTEGLKNSASNVAVPGEIILATRINPGKPVVSKIKVAINQDLKIVKPKLPISIMFLYFAFCDREKQVLDVSNGTTVMGVSLNSLKGIPIPLAPLPEQRAIVARIEQLFSELGNGIANLKTARAKLNIYRQAVLKKAFEGELTRDWRVRQTNLPTADELLEQIKAERQKHYDKQLAEWKAAVKNWEANGPTAKAQAGKPTKKPNKPGKLPEVRGALNNSESPHGMWIYLSDLTEYTTSGSRGWAKYYAGSGAKFIRAQNLKYDKLDLSDIAYVSLPEEAEGTRTLTKQGDLLVTITGANVTKCAYVPHELGETFVSQHVALCRLICPEVAPFLHLFLVAETGGRKQLTKAAYGAGKPGLNLDNIRDLRVPLFSLLEQHQIVQEIESRLSVCDKLAETIDTSLKQAESLRQSILKKAFTGQLLTPEERTACRHEPDWCPACELIRNRGK